MVRHSRSALLVAAGLVVLAALAVPALGRTPIRKRPFARDVGRRVSAPAPAALFSEEEAVAYGLAFAKARMPDEAKAKGIQPELISAVLTTNGESPKFSSGGSQSSNLPAATPVWIVRVKAPNEIPMGAASQESLNHVWDALEVHLDARRDGEAGVLAFGSYGQERQQ